MCRKYTPSSPECDPAGTINQAQLKRKEVKSIINPAERKKPEKAQESHSKDTKRCQAADNL